MQAFISAIRMMLALSLALDYKWTPYGYMTGFFELDFGRKTWEELK